MRQDTPVEGEVSWTVMCHLLKKLAPRWETAPHPWGLEKDGKRAERREASTPSCRAAARWPKMDFHGNCVKRSLQCVSWQPLWILSALTRG